jgi:hypothetical protein
MTQAAEAITSEARRPGPIPERRGGTSALGTVI